MDETENEDHTTILPRSYHKFDHFHTRFSQIDKVKNYVVKLLRRYNISGFSRENF